MRILGIETSCDETAAAVVEATRGQFSVLSDVVASQVKIHAKTGGVVPEVAARAHVETILPVVKMAMKNAECRMKNFGSDIDAIAVTAGPGLVTSLLVGVEVARTLSWLWKKPIVAVNHLAGHVYANFLPAQKIGDIRNSKLDIRTQYPISNIQFPIIALIVSGGHTELVLMRRHLDFTVIGATRDDAAGEAFDKVAKMLNLGYPGGPAIAAEAEKFSQNRHLERPKGVERSHTMQGQEISPLASRLGRNDGLVQFPRPMINQKGDFSAKGGPAYGWDFSFSGLKTAVLYFIKTLKHENIKTMLPQICYEFQEAVVDVLVSKTVRAAKQYKVKTVLLGGGVAANARLRQRLVEAMRRHVPSSVIRLPSLQYTTDNAAMIAAAGYFMARAKQYTPWEKLDVDPNWQLGSKFHSLLRRQSAA